MFRSEGRAKLPYRIRRADRAPFAIAGLWVRWWHPAHPEGDAADIESGTLVVTDANTAPFAPCPTGCPPSCPRSTTPTGWTRTRTTPPCPSTRSALPRRRAGTRSPRAGAPTVRTTTTPA